MDTGTLLSTLHESLFVIVVFLAFLTYALAQGRQAITNVILGLYLALLITIQFPFFDQIMGQVQSPRTESIVMISLFAVFALLATILFAKLMPREYDEGTFEGFGKKFVFAIAATVLVMAYSYNVLPITEFVDPGSPIQALFAPEQWFFAWLILPLVALFLL